MGRLADGLTNMLHRIRESHQENTRLLERISRFNQELQLRVAEATHELANRNEALRRANELLFDLQRELGRAQRMATMGQMAATMAHEIGTAQLRVCPPPALGAEPGLTQQDRQRLVTIDGQIQRLVQTVRERLASTRGEARRLEPTDLNELVRSITDLMAPILDAKGIACSVATEACCRRSGRRTPDPAGGAQPLTNAVDAMPTGGSLRVLTGVAGSTVVLWIADSGTGILPEVRERIFQPFFTTKAQGGGTGLGLAICRQIIEAHRGTIEVTDTPGGGATFEIRLPLESEGGPG
jgi:signal transduction histidine kinase